MPVVINGTTGVTTPSIDASAGNTALTTLSVSGNSVSNIQGNFRNRIINGSFAIWQRGTSFARTLAPDGGFMPDRWWLYGSTPASGTFDRSTDVPTDQGLPYSFFNNTPGNFAIGTNVELYNQGSAAPFVKGQSYTFSFWIKATSSATTTLFAQYENVHASGTDRVAIASTTISITSSWQKITWTFTISVDPNANNKVFALEFASLGPGFKIAGAQLETGSVATPFEFRPIGTELVLCQRYYEQLNYTNTGSGIYSVGFAYPASSEARLYYQYFVPKRAAPTLTAAGSGNFLIQQNATNYAVTTIGSFAIGTSTIWLSATGVSGLTTNAAVVLISGASTSFIGFSAEL